MKPRSILFLAGMGLLIPVAAANPAYDLMIFTCDDGQCSTVVERAASGRGDGTAEVDGKGFRLMIEPLARRSDAEDARVSINVRHGEEADARKPARVSLRQRLETQVLQCTLRQGAFSHLTAFLHGGRTYQIWARLAER